MALTGTVHPPAGATALLAVVDQSSVTLGWYFVPLVLLSCTLMIFVALLVNNVQRRFPVYWWSPKKKEEPAIVIQGVRRNSDEDAMEAGETKRVGNMD
jgi:CBS-domain-containing membrane protein